MTTATMPPSRANRNSVQHAVGEMRDAVRRSLDPLLPTVARDAVQAIEADADVPVMLKKSVRRLLVDQRDFCQTFFGALDKEIGRAVDDLTAGEHKVQVHGAHTGGIDSLSLVDFDQMEETMLLDRMASRIRNAADSSFTPLNQRVATIIGMPGLTDRDNPLYPLRFCRALGAAIDKFGFVGEERQTVMKAFDASLLTPLVGVYKQLNSDLERKGVHEAATAAGFKNTVASFRNTTISSGRETQGAAPTGGHRGNGGATVVGALSAHEFVRRTRGRASGTRRHAGDAFRTGCRDFRAHRNCGWRPALRPHRSPGCAGDSGAVRVDRAGTARVDQRSAAAQCVGDDGRAEQLRRGDDQRTR
jgi:hypothetical protein